MPTMTLCFQRIHVSPHVFFSKVYLMPTPHHISINKTNPLSFHLTSDSIHTEDIVLERMIWTALCKVSSSMSKMRRLYSPPHMSKVSSWHCSPLLHSIMSVDSDSGQQRTWSDYADALSYQGLRCPHWSESTFSHGAARIFLSVLISYTSYYKCNPCLAE